MLDRSRAAKLTALPLVLAVAASASAGTSGGSRDRSFGKDSVAIVDFREWDGQYQQDLMVTRSGKPVGVGNVNGTRFAVARRETDGSRDRTFSRNGRVTTSFSEGLARAHKAARGGNGRILVGGTADGEFALARYRSNGKLDPDFGEGGKVVTVVSPSDDIILDIEHGSDGSITVAGSSGKDRVAWARYLSDGRPDKTFGVGGVLIATEALPDGSIRDVALQEDGKIVATGNAYDDDDPNWDDDNEFALARWNQNGTLDDGFDGNGVVEFPLYSEEDSYGIALAVRSDDKIVAVGTRHYADGDYRAVIVRANADGTPDGSFGSSIESGYDGAVVSTAMNWLLGVTTDGEKTVAVGRRGFQFTVLRLGSDGQPDTSFSEDGLVTQDVHEDAFDYALDAVVHKDKIIVAGNSGSRAFDAVWGYLWSFVRYNR